MRHAAVLLPGVGGAEAARMSVRNVPAAEVLIFVASGAENSRTQWPPTLYFVDLAKKTRAGAKRFGRPGA